MLLRHADYLKFAFVVIALVAFAHEGIAQSTLLNVPTTDVVGKGKVYLEFDFFPQIPATEGRRRNYIYDGRVVVGVASNIEAGFNFPVFRNATTCSPTPSTCGYVEPNLKWKFYNNDSKGIASAAGVILHTPVNEREAQDGWGLLYGEISKKIKTGNNGPRFTGGPYGVVSANENPTEGPVTFVGTRAGVILGYEQPIHSKANIIVDWFSGKNYYGYLTPGVQIALPYNSYLNIGYAIGNDSHSDPSNNNRFLYLYYGITFP